MTVKQTTPGVTWQVPFLSSVDTRRTYIEFFKKHAHTFVPSCPVVPHDDPTLLFINSGMNQFKSIFLGENRDGLKRAVNSQKCLRVSGKHNDLDEVGRDTYHHTFFEMLGNWSFGDYYKKEAIAWAWQLLTDVWKLPPERLFVTVYNDDDEAYDIWKAQRIPEWRIMRFGEKSNFWEMGEVGPCGPCTEIHFDMGDPSTQKDTYSHPEEGVNGTNARYIEIWNNVFMQYERLQDGSLKPLKSKHVDTGMGLERICAILQGKASNYDTDLFMPLINKIAELTKVPYQADERGTPHRVIADHVRALSFAIADGATPGNEGRGYVLRRILRRASRFSQQLEQKDPFIFKLVPTLVEAIGGAYPELSARQLYIAQVIETEEKRFMHTLRDGLTRFQKIAQETQKKGKKEIPGQDVFTLYDTYGFPADLTGVLAEEAGLGIDQAGFETCMNEQRERARSAAKFDASLATEEGWTILSNTGTQFIGYDTLETPVSVTRYREVGDDILVCLDHTPFYAEAGGQVGDVGSLKGPQLTLKVTDTFKILDMHVHRCSLEHGLLTPENLKGIVASVDKEKRAATVRNHSATHLLHAALRQVLGEQVQQQGSRVAPEGLRFDFTHSKALTPEETAKVELLVNEQIVGNHVVSVAEKALEEAKSEGAVALFGEKYGASVRTIKIGPTSYELCGGTHAQATGDIGFFTITNESSIAAGIRRIEAVTGFEALKRVQQHTRILTEAARSLKARPEEIATKLDEINEKLRSAERELKQLKADQVQGRIKDLLASGQNINGTNCLIKKLSAQDFPKDTHQLLLDQLAGQLGDGIAVLTHVEGDTLSLLAAVGADARKRIKAGDLIKVLSEVAGGRGGGRPDRAQAGSKHPENEQLVLSKAKEVMLASLN